MARDRRQFTDEQKAAAVRLVHSSGRSVAQVAGELDLTVTALRRWVDQARRAEDASAGPLGGEERRELVRLRRENQTLRQERDFLKKAAAFFARENDERSK
jgi:transposase